MGEYAVTHADDKSSRSANERLVRCDQFMRRWQPCSELGSIHPVRLKRHQHRRSAFGVLPVRVRRWRKMSGDVESNRPDVRPTRSPAARSPGTPIFAKCSPGLPGSCLLAGLACPPNRSVDECQESGGRHPPGTASGARPARVRLPRTRIATSEAPRRRWPKVARRAGGLSRPRVIAQFNTPQSSASDRPAVKVVSSRLISGAVATLAVTALRTARRRRSRLWTAVGQHRGLEKHSEGQYDGQPPRKRCSASLTPVASSSRTAVQFASTATIRHTRVIFRFVSGCRTTTTHSAKPHQDGGQPGHNGAFRRSVLDRCSFLDGDRRKLSGSGHHKAARTGRDHGPAAVRRSSREGDQWCSTGF